MVPIRRCCGAETISDVLAESAGELTVPNRAISRCLRLLLTLYGCSRYVKTVLNWVCHNIKALSYALAATRSTLN